MVPPEHVLVLANRIGALRLLALLLSAPPDEPLLRRLACLEADAKSARSRAIKALAQAAAQSRAERASEEFYRLFVGLGGGELTPYASHYLAGGLHEAPLVRIRDDMRRLGLARAPGTGEPEDHISTVLEIAAGLIDGSIACEPVQAAQFIGAHVLPWAPRLFDDLSGSEAEFYSTVGIFGAATMLEEAAFAQDAPGGTMTRAWS